MARSAEGRGQKGKSKAIFKVQEHPPKDVSEAKAEAAAVALFAKHMAVSPQTARKLLNGGPVYPNTLQNLASKFDCSVVELVDLTEIELPTSPDKFSWYTKLNLSFYIDNNRETIGGPLWYFERLSLKMDDGEPSVGVCSFTGTMQNQFDNVFDVKAFLMDRHLFTILCTPRNKASQLCFSASFTRMIKLKGTGIHGGKEFVALDGTWSGIDHLGRNAIYRMFLTVPGVIDCSAQPELNSIRLLLEAIPGYNPDNVPGMLELIDKAMKASAEDQGIASDGGPAEVPTAAVSVPKKGKAK